MRTWTHYQHSQWKQWMPGYPVGLVLLVLNIHQEIASPRRSYRKLGVVETPSQQRESPSGPAPYVVVEAV